MFTYPRRSAPKVRDGKVQRKNRWSPTRNGANVQQPQIKRQRPGWGYRHLVVKEHLRRFIRLIPEWGILSVGLNMLILAKGSDDALGWYAPGRVALCAWERDIILSETSHRFYWEHQGILQRLGVPCLELSDGWQIRFDENTARAFQLIHVLIHELGHHHDRITTWSKRGPTRGERYAEAYARRYEDLLVVRYRNEFGL